MDSKVDKDGFIYVSSKRKKKNKILKPTACSLPVTKDTLGLQQNFDKIINDIQEELKHSDFIATFRDNIASALMEWDLPCPFIVDKEEFKSLEECSYCKYVDQWEQLNIVCYGLGQFSSCIIARYQLGFLLLLKKIVHATNIYIYDPQFSVEEISFLKSLGMNVLHINEEGKRHLKGKSVCFMPHCDLPLYNNLLWANWNIKHLSEIAIIGNSFQSYNYRYSKGRLKETAKYVYLANEFVTEMPIRNNFHLKDIFNDLSIHYFTLNILGNVPLHYWSDLDDPEYGDDDGIIKANK